MTLVPLGDGERDEAAFFAVITPLRYKNKLYLTTPATPLGFDTDGKYLLLTEGDAPVDGADGYEAYILCGGKRYALDRAEDVRFRGRTLYRWCVVHLLEDRNEQ